VTDLKELQKHRPFLAWAEIAGLLHDLGKLSRIWLDYRRTWQDPDNGGSPSHGIPKWDWRNDPHENWFGGKYDSLLEGTGYSKLQKTLMNPGPAGPGVFSRLAFPSIAEVIGTHCSADFPTLIGQLRIADSIDSAHDRNNPLFCREQKGAKLFDTELYGAESKKPLKTIESMPDDTSSVYQDGYPPAPHVVESDRIDAVRRKLYDFLSKDNLLESYLEDPVEDNNKGRLKILGAIRWAFDQAMSDTSRPSNDTTLWEHCYSVAALFRAALGRTILTGEPFKNFSEFRFRLLGVGWDGLGFLASARRLGDTLGRRGLLDEVVHAVRAEVEWEWLAGSLVYWDIDSMVFIVPWLEGSPFEPLENAIRSIFIKRTHGDVLPVFELSGEMRSLTGIVKVLAELRKKRAVPVRGLEKLSEEEIDECLERPWQDKSASRICPVCRRRPIPPKYLESFQRCEICRERMGKASKLMLLGSEKTVFLSEIADKESRLALLLVHFGLDPWLDGRMQRTMFVTERDGLEKELEECGSINGFEEEHAIREKRKDPKSPADEKEKYSYNNIVRDMNICYTHLGDGNNREKAALISFLYGHRTNKDPDAFKEYAQKLLEVAASEYPELKTKAADTELLAALVCTKTPTPSTILDSWSATLRFTRQLAATKDNGKIFDCIEKCQRHVMETEDISDSTPEIHKWTPYEAKLKISKSDGKHDGKDVEIVWRSNTEAFIISSLDLTDCRPEELTDLHMENRPVLKNKITVLARKPDEAYYPLREVAASPTLGLFIVPADKALNCAQFVRNRYDEEFGKVRGRLPLHLGLIVFNKRHAMHLVLDAAQRMLDGFERLGRNPETATAASDAKPDEKNKNKMKLRLSLEKRGKREVDFVLDTTLGDGEPDFHHPYLVVQDKPGMDSRPSYFKTIAWKNDGLEPVLLAGDVQKDDVIRLMPGAFDFEHLDSVERRWDLRYDPADEKKPPHRRSLPFPFHNKPYLLEELAEFEIWWKRLKGKEPWFGKPVTDTQIHKLESLWVKALIEWDVDLAAGDENDEKFKTWKALVEASLRREFSKMSSDKLRDTVAAVTGGLLLDALELYLHILKQKLESSNDSPSKSEVGA